MPNARTSKPAKAAKPTKPAAPTKPAGPTKPAKRAEPVLSFDDAEAWDRWLAANHACSGAVMLRLVKGAARAFGYADALDVALAWGWIDSHKRAADETAWLQRFGPRTRTSPWSKINREKIERLIAAGKMKPSGQAEVERAKADGRWERAYDGARTATVPDDLAAALTRRPKARAFFAALDAANRYAILHRVMTAKKPETRAERIEKLVAMCARGERLHPRASRTPALGTRPTE
ncbi:MAG: YdeI/OmpD-associated family protein [Myxococcales bacterium]|nr:YdeI/OmpD-associated family protein [Myxococcales bacterium]